MTHRNISRSGIWRTGEAQLELPFEARGLSNIVVVNAQLKLTPDYDVFTWLTNCWLMSEPREPEIWPTLWEIGYDLYGKQPSGKDYATLKASIRRLAAASVVLDDYNAFDCEPAVGSESFSHLMEVVKPKELQPQHRPGFRLAEWVRIELAKSQTMRIDWEVLRRFHQNEQLAKRLWIYLAAESYKRSSLWGRDAAEPGLAYESTWIAEGDRLAASLGLSYAEPSAFRRSLRRAIAAIIRTDDRWALGHLELQTERRGRNTYSRIVGIRPDGASWTRVKGKYRDTRGEREVVRKQIKASLAAADAAC